MQNSRRPLEGLKVLEAGTLVIVPLASSWLSALGATVIKLESGARPDVLRSYVPFQDGIPGPDRAACFTEFNSDKYSLTLDLKNPHSAVCVERLLKWADVTVNNFRAGVPEKLGLGYEQARAVNPDIVMVSASVFGQEGPLAPMSGLGTMFQSYVGLTYSAGWPDRQTVGANVGYTDGPGACWVGIGVMLGLLYKQTTGKSIHVDMSHCEAALQFMGPYILDALANGTRRRTFANRHPFACPHGAFRCQGDDRWCTIAVLNEKQWHGFCRAVGHPELVEDARFVNLAARKAHENDLEMLVERWTSERTPEKVMALMQEHGVPAGVVQEGKELLEDPQLRFRGAIPSLEHPVLGQVPTLTNPPFTLSKTPSRPQKAAPCLGEHTAYICLDMLGMSVEEFVELDSKGVFK